MRKIVPIIACMALPLSTLPAQEVAARSSSGALSAIPTTPPKPGTTKEAASGSDVAKPADAGFTPSWETQKQARTYLLGIPAPRGQIVDRHGNPLAQTRVSHNLAIAFPTPL